jgi:hypothetical protein
MLAIKSKQRKPSGVQEELRTLEAQLTEQSRLFGLDEAQADTQQLMESIHSDFLSRMEERGLPLPPGADVRDVIRVAGRQLIERVQQRWDPADRADEERQELRTLTREFTRSLEDLVRRGQDLPLSLLAQRLEAMVEPFLSHIHQLVQREPKSDETMEVIDVTSTMVSDEK